MIAKNELVKDLMVKSNYIIEASYYLTLQEQRIVYLLTTKINKDDEEFKSYKFSAKELTSILSNHRMSLLELKGYIDKLRNRELTIVKDNSVLVSKWLSSAEYFDDGTVELCFDKKLKPFFLQLKKEFTKLSLQGMFQFNSRYSCRIYELLKRFIKIGHRNLSIEELRNKLGIDCDKYKLYSDFKRKVILKAQKEINKKSDIQFDFQEVKKGRKVESLKFFMEFKDEIAVIKDLKQPKDDYIEKVLDIIKSPQITPIEAQKIYDSAKGDLKQIHKVYEHFKNKKLDNFVGMMISMVKPGAFQEPKANNPVDNFNDYKQRQYNFDDLEKGLLGWQDEN